ncbi:glutathione biosynthesis bifunctional protein gshF [Aquipluma nitroreducens]|uniref:Glutamate--cysteine ligase n=1 Tax=Aquipluma nitroreducens TaxID=2010828 RepID=A0A5K7S5K6_9BACT|nr:bifunctional glutamate--cysteine ligase GshA/glutathione synthetase GshB [Aquipluma nitroreducens]BBE16823.1 glutathione biosynthesis bifunctional protein gshF [Aquipluma nitroreducens]
MKLDFFQSTLNSLKGNIWLEGLFGLEKENIRVDQAGNLAQTPHPKIFGNKLKHPYITTDFSESQVEMITPPLSEIGQAIGFLETIHDIVSLELKDEYLWPQSIPPILPADQHIPIAQYDEDGKEAREYREFLAQKYGPKNQLFSGIHFNFSYSEKLLELLYRNANSQVSFDEFKDEVYLKTARQMLRLRWLYILMYGDSPVVDPSFELQCKMAPYPIENNVIALSIRNSCFGYQNFDDLFPDYSTITSYKSSINQMIKDEKIAAAKELYSPVRPKFIRNPDHISYLEFRFIDIDPLTKAGISDEALRFLHALALYGLLTDEPDDFGTEAQTEANRYHTGVAMYGLNVAPFLISENGKQYSIWTKAQTIIKGITDLFESLGIDDPKYHESLNQSMNLIENPRERKVYEVLKGIVKMGYIPFHIEKAKQYLDESRNKNYNFWGLEDLELSTQLLLREAVKRGVSFEILDQKENFVRFRKDGNTQYVKQATKTSLDNYSSILAMENKLVTKKILEEHQIRVPKGTEYTSADVAKADFLVHQGKPVVIKPNQTNFGLGITILKENVDEQTYQRAIEIAFEFDSTILIEEFISGKEFRFFVIGDEVVGILHRVPANVTGDGTKTIRELVELKNQDPLRGKGYRTPLEKIRLEEAEAMFLKQQVKDFDTIPASGEIVYLRENSNISTGGDSIDFTDDIPDSYKQIAVQATKALNVVITGLDMIIPEVSDEATVDNYAIIELNFNPAIHIHCHPFKGKNRRLNEKLMDALGY